MEQSILGNGKANLEMVKVFKLGQMVLSMMDIGRTIKRMVMENFGT